MMSGAAQAEYDNQARAKKQTNDYWKNGPDSKKLLCQIGQRPEARITEFVIHAIVVNEPRTGEMEQPAQRRDTQNY